MAAQGKEGRGSGKQGGTGQGEARRSRAAQATRDMAARGKEEHVSATLAKAE